jgi:pimeloyl-ACP methyl ester carboxylesterase
MDRMDETTPPPLTPPLKERGIRLSTGITMNVALAGPDDAPPVILIHGFPESHRTWRDLVPLLADRFRLIMPDLRGFGESDRPQDVADYATDTLIADIFALADALGIDRFALVGHDWGGAIAWAAALRGDPRIERLAIINSPHPLIFQKSLIEDAAQRAASQYMSAFRSPLMEAGIQAMGFPTFFEKSFSKHVDLARIPDEERQRYIDDWSRPGALTAMLNWYRSSQVTVPAVGEDAAMPAWVERGLPRLHIPVCVIWGLEDKALLPVQLEGIGEVGVDVEVFPLKGVGHFAPWEAPDRVAEALKPFLLPQISGGGGSAER